MIGKLWFGVKYILGQDVPGLNIIARRDDIFIVSYSKSGNTWMRFLIANLIQRDKPVRLPDIDRMVPHCEGATRRFFAYMPGPRIIASHGSFDPQIKRVIYIVRDPRDVAVSLYKFLRKRAKIADDYPMHVFISRFLAGDTPPDYGSWAENVASWLATRYDSPGFLLLRYEDLLADTPRELTKIASFLGITVPAAELVEVAERSSAKRMRELEKTQGAELGVMKSSRPDIPFVGSASAGGWRSNLPEDLVAKIESAWGPLMVKLGYDILYSEHESGRYQERTASSNSGRSNHK